MTKKHLSSILIIIILPLFLVVTTLPANQISLTELNRKLLDGAKDANLLKVAALIRDGADVNTRTGGSSTPLMKLASAKQDPSDPNRSKQIIEIARLLLENGAQIDATNDFGLSALHRAIARNNIPLVTFLLGKGASLDSAANAVDEAVDKKNIDMIKLLHQLGVSLDAPGISGRTPLMGALTFSKDLGIARLLLELGADPDIPDMDNQTALMFAATFSDPIILKMLLAASGPEKVNIRSFKNNTALHYAAGAGKEKNIELLLNAGALINAKNSWGYTPLHNTSHILSAKALLDAGADVNSTDKTGATLLNRAAEKGDPELISLLLSYGADMNHVDDNGECAMFRLASRGHTKAIEVLCDKKANVNILRGPNGPSPLIEAIIRNHPDTALMLINCGAQLNYIDSAGNAAIHCAAERTNALPVLQRLIDEGADINIQGRNKKTALMCAADIENAKRLIEAGADFSITDKKGETALSYAEKFRRHDIVEYLEKLDGKKTSNHGVQNNKPALKENQKKEGHPSPLSKIDQKLLINSNRFDYTLMLELIQAGADVNARDTSGNTPLMRLSQSVCQPRLNPACEENQIRIATLLLDRGADINALNSKNTSALHMAISQNNLRMVAFFAGKGASWEGAERYVPNIVQKKQDSLLKLLCQHKVSVDGSTKGGRAPLLSAIGYMKDSHMAQVLLDLGAKPFIVDNEGQTTLMLSALLPDAKVLKKILRLTNPNNIHMRNKKGETALHYAARAGNAEHLSLLINSGANKAEKDLDGNTPLHVISEMHGKGPVEQYVASAKVLLNVGAQIDALDKIGNTPFLRAVEGANPEFLRLLISSGANINHVNENGDGALHKWASNGNVAAIRVLAAYKPEVNMINDRLQSPLLEALSNGKIEAALALMACGADICYMNKQTDMAAIHAIPALSKSDTLFEKLLEMGADINRQGRDGFTPLMRAIRTGHFNTASGFIDRGADIHIKDREGKTALHYAIESNKKDAIQVLQQLIKLGADINCQDRKGHTPLMLARDIARGQRLVEAGADTQRIDLKGRTALDHAKGRKDAGIVSLLETNK